MKYETRQALDLLPWNIKPSVVSAALKGQSTRTHQGIKYHLVCKLSDLNVPVHSIDMSSWYNGTLVVDVVLECGGKLYVELVNTCTDNEIVYAVLDEYSRYKTTTALHDLSDWVCQL